jgi:4-hydroxybenzoate polyprenyltransferase
MFERVRHFLELIRFSHTVFALPFALLSAALAWQKTPFRVRDLVGILVCMVLARSAAMAFNRLVDRDVDAANPRTVRRHIPAGLLTPRAVTMFIALCSIGFVATTLVFLPNRWPLILSVPVLLFLFGYSYAKRFTSICHYWLSAALMLSPIAAWIAIRGTIELPPVLLAAVVFFWVGGFDILYATQDADFDRQRGLSSIPARVGIPAALKIAAFSHLLTVLSLFALWRYAPLGNVFLVGVIVLTLLLIYEHSLVRPDDLSRVNTAFFHVNAAISVGILVLGVTDIWLASH